MFAVAQVDVAVAVEGAATIDAAGAAFRGEAAVARTDIAVTRTEVAVPGGDGAVAGEEVAVADGEIAIAGEVDAIADEEVAQASGRHDALGIIACVDGVRVVRLSVDFRDSPSGVTSALLAVRVEAPNPRACVTE